MTLPGSDVSAFDELGMYRHSPPLPPASERKPKRQSRAAVPVRPLPPGKIAMLGGGRRARPGGQEENLTRSGGVWWS